MNIRDFLTQGDYKRYRNVRAAAVMFVLLGGMFAFTGTVLLAIDPQSAQSPPPKIVPFLLMLVGAAGAIGGIAAFVANRKWSRLIYIMASVYVLVFPIGTILSIVMFIGLERYLDDVARFRQAVTPPAAG